MLMHLLEEISYCSWYETNSWIILRFSVAALHGKGLTATGLTVGEDGGMITLNDLVKQVIYFTLCVEL